MRDGDLLAFDTGPGNALIDDWMRERAGKRFDEDGAAAAAGRPDETLLAWLLVHPYFAQASRRNRSTATGSRPAWSATCPSRTARRRSPPSRPRAVGRAVEFAEEEPKRWIVGGGGAQQSGADADARRRAEGRDRERRRGRLVLGRISRRRPSPISRCAACAACRSPFRRTTGVCEAMTGGVVARP